ncbi:MAG: hypothetical protein M3458_17825 [Acidobacteriota bacterium]|nr:hypothetical protein [Acidobacteriota bacterium]
MTEHAASNAALRSRERRSSTWSRFTAEVQASVETAFSRLFKSAITIIPSVFAALLVIGLFWAIAAGVRWLMRVIFRRFVENITTESLIKQVAYYSRISSSLSRTKTCPWRKSPE